MENEATTDQQWEIAEQVTVIQDEWLQLLNAAPNEIYCNRPHFRIIMFLVYANSTRERDITARSPVQTKF